MTRWMISPLKPGAANLFGLVQGKNNAIAPGKRPLSSMSPTIVAKDGKTFMVLGSPGGSRIISIVAQVIIDVIDYGMNDPGSGRMRRASIINGCPTRSPSSPSRSPPTRSRCSPRAGTRS